MNRAFLIFSGMLLATAGLALEARAADASQELLFPDAPLVLVEDQVITLSDVLIQSRPEERTLASQFRGKELKDKIEAVRRDFAIRLANEELLYAEFKQKEFKVPQEFLHKRMDNIIQAQAGGSREKFEQTLASQGMTYTEFEQAVLKSSAVDLMVNEFVRRLVRISPAEIRDYYTKHQDEFAEPARVRLAMIQLKPDGKYADKLDATAVLIRHQFSQGADFSWLAKEYSEADTAANKGDLGWMKVEDVQPAFREAVKDLAPGDVAEPIRLAGNVVLLKLVEKESQRILPLDEKLSRKIEDKLGAIAEKKRLEAYVATLKSKYRFRLLIDAK